jgi:hypothetical protein
MHKRTRKGSVVSSEPFHLDFTVFSNLVVVIDRVPYLHTRAPSYIRRNARANLKESPLGLF